MTGFRPVRSRLDHWAANRADHLPRFNPTLFLLLLALGGSVMPTALGLQALPGSLEQAGPTLLSQGSAALVVLGCFTAALGMAWWRSIDRGLALEIAGKTLLGVGLLFYAFALFQYQTVANRAYVFGMSAGLAVGCFVRAFQIALYVRGRFLRAEEERHKGDW